MDVSIILVNYNTCNLTCEAIASVYQFTKLLDFEIILVDNNSLDESVNTVAERFPKVNIIQNDQNLGFGKANNIGMKVAKGKYIFLLNTDTYLINNAIEILYDYMETNSHVAVCGGKLLTPELTYNVSAGNFPNYRLFVKGSFLKYFYPRNYYKNEVRTIIPTESKVPYAVDYVSGADFFVRKNIIDEVGGFDERFFMYAEDAELAYRIKKKYPSMVSHIIPDARIVHISQGSAEKERSDLKFKMRLIKGRATYFKIIEGKLSGMLYYLTNVMRLYTGRR